MTLNNNELIWAKVNENAIIPTKRDEDAGYDIYPCFDENYIIIEPHRTKMIPTGIASAFSDDYVAILKERGSTGSKGIAQRSGVIDSGFRGEWMFPITNTTNMEIVISKISSDLPITVLPYNKAICQALILRVPKMTTRVVTYEELNGVTSERGSGLLGSSGK